MKESVKMVAALLSGITVGKTVNSLINSSVEDRSLLFNAGKIISVGAVTLASTGFTYNTIDIIDKKVGGMVKKTVDKYKEFYEEAVKKEDSVTVNETDDIEEEDDYESE